MHASFTVCVINLKKKKKHVRGEKEKKKKKIRIKGKQHRYREGEGGERKKAIHAERIKRRAQGTHVTKVWHETTPIALPCKNNRGNRTNRFMNRVYAYETKPKQLLRCSQLYSIYIWKQVKKQYPTGAEPRWLLQTLFAVKLNRRVNFFFFYSTKRKWFSFLMKFFTKIRME